MGYTEECRLACFWSVMMNHAVQILFMVNYQNNCGSQQRSSYRADSGPVSLACELQLHQECLEHSWMYTSLLYADCAYCPNNYTVSFFCAKACNVISQTPAGRFTMVIPHQHRNCSFSIIYPVVIKISDLILGRLNSLHLKVSCLFVS